MVNYVSAIVFVFLLGPGLILAWALGGNPPHAALALVVWVLLDLFVASAIRLAAEGESRTVVFRLGKLSSVKGPGLFAVIPLIDWVRMIDTRVQAMEISRQQVITKDNVPVSIDGVLFFRVVEAALAVIKVQDFRVAVFQYARTSLRDVVGQMTSTSLLAREQIEATIGSHVEKDTRAYLHVESIRMEDIDMPEEPEEDDVAPGPAEREKRANTKAEGDRDAAVNLAQAAQTMRESPGAMQLRTRRRSTAWDRRRRTRWCWPFPSRPDVLNGTARLLDGRRAQ
jgi:regulator of protease activity HflC (stomatin/prohibitin superfamily)